MRVSAKVGLEVSSTIFKSLLNRHARSHVPKEERIVFPCHLCHKKFSSNSAVSAHLKASYLREGPFVCEQCGHSFTSRCV